MLQGRRLVQCFEVLAWAFASVELLVFGIAGGALGTSVERWFEASQAAQIRRASVANAGNAATVAFDEVGLCSGVEDPVAGVEVVAGAEFVVAAAASTCYKCLNDSA